MGRKGRNRREEKRKSKDSRIGKFKDHLKFIFNSNPEEAFSYRQLIKLTGIRDAASKEALKELLFKMERKGSLTRLSDGRFKTAMQASVIQGRVDHVNPKFAYIISEDS